MLALENDEWQQGRTMYLLCALQLQKSFGHDGILEGTIERVAQAIFRRSEENAATMHKDPTPGLAARVPALLPATKDGWPWLGAQRGLIGVVHALLTAADTYGSQKHWSV